MNEKVHFFVPIIYNMEKIGFAEQKCRKPPSQADFRPNKKNGKNTLYTKNSIKKHEW